MSKSVPPRDGSVRWARYKARFRPDAEGRLPQGCSELMARMMQDPVLVGRVQASLDALSEIEARVRTVPDAAGVDTIQYVSYFDFGRELWKMTNRVGGASAALAAAALAGKWQTRGLSRPVLEKVCFEVFNLTLREEV